MTERLRPNVDQPAWYKLDSDKGTVTIDAHKKAVPTSSSLDLERISRLQKLLELPEPFLHPSSDREWGFGPVLAQLENQNSDWITYKCLLPHPKANGEIDWDRLYSTAATLQLLFRHLKQTRPETNSAIPQMLVIDLFLRERGVLYGSSLEVNIEPALCGWINQNAGNDKTEQIISRSMRESFKRMLGKLEEFDHWYFSASLRDPKWIHLSCPGNACGLDPSDSYYHDHSLDQGYELLPHNTDNPWQQLTLLSGLSKIDKLASKNYE